MRVARLKRRDGDFDFIECYETHEFPFDKIRPLTLTQRGKKPNIRDIIITFDIETTTMNGIRGKRADGKKGEWIEKPYGFMYHWQMCIGGFVAYGRTWESWVDIMTKLCDHLDTDDNNNIIVWVHNLGFEYQFIYPFLDKYFDGHTFFASQKRKPMKVTTGNGIEFRCSWKLSNMNLQKFTENEKGVVHVKAVNDLDYRKIRTPETYLDDTEFGYCISDVVGQYEAIACKMANDGDDLTSIPLTSTGYVRRDCRNATRKNKHYFEKFRKDSINATTYQLLLEESRGGDTHANRYMAGLILTGENGIDSFDIQSSYPFQLLTREFPSKFVYYGDVESKEEFDALRSKNACLFRMTFYDLRVKNDVVSPYIPIAKCRNMSNIVADNGRVLSGNLEITLNDVDYKIIEKQYTCKSKFITDMHIAKYKPLPEELRQAIFEYFESKCKLKYDLSQAKSDEQRENIEYLYMKSKNKLNGIFGMMFTKPIHAEIEISEIDGQRKWIEKAITEQSDIAKALAEYYNSRNNFLQYSWGCWCTAWARLSLHDLFQAVETPYMENGIETQGTNIYGDTDSSKCFNPNFYEIERLNKIIMEIDEEKGAFCDYNGIRYYLGLYEHETEKEKYRKFITLGAKKYAYEDSKGLHITISGVNKRKGGKELGQIENFKRGFTFIDGGGTELHYNDEVIHTITVDNVDILTASNIAVLDSTYTLGITPDYAELTGIEFLDIFLDEW